MADVPCWVGRGILLCLLLGVASPAGLRAQTIDIGGLAYVDYFYNLSSIADAEEDLHGFTYRRLYLTTDFELSDRFAGRARLEANDATSGSHGPVPFVKDLFVTWTYAGTHSATFGVGPPPAFEIAEGVWNYRSLEKTILDFQGIVNSRDFGLRFDGPITSRGLLRYAAMIANNNASRPESDAYKRAYVQISAHPLQALSMSVGADRAGYGDLRSSSTRVSGFGGYDADAFRVGLEGYWMLLNMDNSDEFAHTGVSLFGSVRVAPRWEVVARIDRSMEELPGADLFETFFLGGLSFQPDEFVRLIPNIWVLHMDGSDESEVTGRFTVFVTF
jgi:hypothetical protein